MQNLDTQEIELAAGGLSIITPYPSIPYVSPPSAGDIWMVYQTWGPYYG